MILPAVGTSRRWRLCTAPSKSFRLTLNPSAGENYYYLAEAWLMKIDARRAGEFNRMAEDHFKNDLDWLRRIAGQADRISELEK